MKYNWRSIQLTINKDDYVLKIQTPVWGYTSMFDLSRCIVWQKVTDIKCPLKSLVPYIGARQAVYPILFLKNVAQYRKLHALPVNLKLEENNTSETLCLKFASRLKSSYLKFSFSKLEKAQERKNKTNLRDDLSCGKCSPTSNSKTPGDGRLCTINFLMIK